MARPRLSNLSLAELRKELTRRQELLPKLIAQRDALDRQIAQLQGSALPEVRNAAEPEVAPKRARRHRAKNKVGLPDALAIFMEGKAKVTIGEAMEGVLAAGYNTKSKAFRQLVNKTLLSDKRFRRVGRGEFALKE